MPSILVKRSSAADNLLLFLVSAASSVLLTRLYLYIFDYPTIGGSRFHIAHAIIGGALLTISYLLMLCFHGRRVRQLSAVVGGWGFGLFIDEIGKFITRDNNYFYQPASVIIYLCFIIFFFLYRRLERYTPKDPQELSYDLIEKMEDLADNRFYQPDKVSLEETISKIMKAPKSSYRYFAAGVHQLLLAMPIRTNPRRHRIYSHITSSWKWLDDFLAERRPVFYMLVAIFLVYVGLTFWTMSAFLYRLLRDTLNPAHYGINSQFELIVYIAELASQMVSALWMCQGFWRLLRRERRKALVLFKNALAINILITHVFAFYIEQFSAAFSLVGMLVLFVLVENILEEHVEE